jgi:hypothetical protein
MGGKRDRLFGGILSFVARLIEVVGKLTDPPAIAYNNSVSDQ